MLYEAPWPRTSLFYRLWGITEDKLFLFYLQMNISYWCCSNNYQNSLQLMDRCRPI